MEENTTVATTDAILHINRSDSRCGACGKNADPAENAHTMTTMHGVGCGATYVAVSSNYFGMEDRVRAMRPDLPFQSFTRA